MGGEPGDIEALRAEVVALREQLAASDVRAEALARIAAIVDRAPDFIGMSGLNGELVFLNEAGRRAIGIGLEEDLAGCHAPDTVAERFRPHVFGEGSSTLAREGVWQGEAALLCRDGREIPISVALSAHRGPDGRPRNVSAIMRDITAEKRLENDLRAAEERLRHLLKSSPIVVYTAEAHGVFKVTFVSDSVTEVLGYSPADFTEGEGFWRKHIHPDDQPRVLEQLDRIIERGQNSYEYRFLDARGRYLWLLDQSKVVHDAAGAPREIVGSVLDITARKEAEQTVMDLSTPLIPVSDRVLVMPLVGRIDKERVDLVLSTLLEGIGRQRAKVAILDVTGVDQVDQAVAAGLVKAAQAVELLGAEVVITGIRPAMAQALVEIGVDLSRIVTRGSLQAGIAYAMRRG